MYSLRESANFSYSDLITLGVSNALAMRFAFTLSLETVLEDFVVVAV